MTMNPTQFADWSDRMNTAHEAYLAAAAAAHEISTGEEANAARMFLAAKATAHLTVAEAAAAIELLNLEYQQFLGPQDVTLPTVVSTFPADGATGVAVATALSVTFAEAMHPDTMVPENFAIASSDGGGTLDITDVDMSEDGKTATLTVDDPPTAGPYTYKISVSSEVTDLYGNFMDEPYEQTTGFATEADVVAPTVVSTSPANGATGVSVGATISVTFSEAMDESATDQLAVFLVAAGGGAADVATTGVTLSSGNRVATLTMAGALTAATVYKIRVTTDATDALGNPIAAQFTQAAGFTTAA